MDLWVSAVWSHLRCDTNGAGQPDGTHKARQWTENMAHGHTHTQIKKQMKHHQNHHSRHTRTKALKNQTNAWLQIDMQMWTCTQTYTLTCMTSQEIGDTCMMMVCLGRHTDGQRSVWWKGMNSCTPPHTLLYKDGHMLPSDRQTSTSMNALWKWARTKETEKHGLSLKSRNTMIHLLSRLMSHLFGNFR